MLISELIIEEIATTIRPVAATAPSIKSRLALICPHKKATSMLFLFIYLFVFMVLRIETRVLYMLSKHH
jgi:hypothetical protein